MGGRRSRPGHTRPASAREIDGPTNASIGRRAPLTRGVESSVARADAYSRCRAIDVGFAHAPPGSTRRGRQGHRDALPDGDLGQAREPEREIPAPGRPPEAPDAREG